MNRLLILAFAMVACGDDPPPTIGGGDMAPSGDISGTGGAGGAAGMAGAGGMGGAVPKGACDNGPDLDAIEGASSGLRNIARDCGLFVCAASVGASNAYGECVANCVRVRVTGLSADCAGCYGDLGRCGLDALCRFQCQANTCSTPCLNCLNGASCITDFEDCRGIPGDGCPG